MVTRLELALAMLTWGLEIFSRRDLGMLLFGGKVCSSERHVERLLNRLKQEQLLQQTGRGKNARFTITDAGRQRLRVERPADSWDRVWDGRWHVFMFDLPMHRNKDRMVLWRGLNTAKMGLLQRSVWIWPHPVTQLLAKIIEARGIPECFCGFEAGQLFLCDDAELVATAWDHERIDRAHDVYLKQLVATPATIARAKDLQELAHLARLERDNYRLAFERDPLLPRQLWVKNYRGPKVEERHQEFLAALRRRARELSGPAVP
jgi:DNA-binding transcriptional regulator PaaX